MIAYILLALLAVQVSPAVLELAQPAIACDSTRLAAVEFLRGRWQVRSREPSRSPPRERTGTAVVTAIAGRCALQENLTLGESYEETRLLAFDERSGTWQLAVVDGEHGNLVVMTGHAVEKGLEFISTHQRSNTVLVDRVSLTRTSDGWIMQTETASGYGAPWRLLQELAYTRDQ